MEFQSEQDGGTEMKDLLCSKAQNTVQNAYSTSAMACREHCLLVQQKPDTLVVFTNSVLHQSVRSEFMFQTSKLVSRDISIVSIFIQFLCPCL